MKVVIAGASGFIGPALSQHLRGAGHEVVRLVRRPAQADDEVTWDPTTGDLDRAALDGVQAGINLAGMPLADRRWTPQVKRELRASRIDATRTLAEALADLDAEVLLQSSAIGVYGHDTGDAVVSETTPVGTDFLADLCVDWEAAARPARESGVRVAALRTGLVMGPSGGAFEPLLRMLRLGVGGPMGRGHAWWSWITLLDQVRAMEFLLENDVDGPVNLVAPEPVRNRTLIRAIAQAMRRPSLLSVPPIALKVMLGEFADEVLASRRIIPGVLLDAGFEFHHAGVHEAAEWLVAEPR